MLKKRNLLAVAVMCFLAAAATVVLAQVDPAAPVVPPDWHSLVPGVILALVTGLIVPFVTYAIRLGIPKIPRIVIPFVALAFSGPVLTYVLGWVAQLNTSYWGGVLAGAIGIVIREIWSTWAEHGTGS